MQNIIENLLQGIARFFGDLFRDAPLVWGSPYPVFFAELLLIIILFDFVIFGWRPLVRRFAPRRYSAVDYIFGLTVDLLAALALVAFDVYLGASLGDSWGRWLGISGLVWSTVAVIALLFVGRFVSALASRK